MFDGVFAHQSVVLPKHPTGISIFFSWDFFNTQTLIVEGGFKFWLSQCCLFVESLDKKGERLIYSTEIWENAFNWRKVTFEGEEIRDFTEFEILDRLESFTVDSQSSAVRSSRKRDRLRSGIH